MIPDLRVAALAGGVGGARLADGLAQVLPPENLTIIVNVGDDFEHLGLYICPDLDTVCYTLAGAANPETGWGRQGETWRALDVVAALDGPSWFRLGDLDLGLQLVRTSLLAQGQPLSRITRHITSRLAVHPVVLPVTDMRVPTMVLTASGQLPFQDYFVRQQCEPVVTGFVFSQAEQAVPAPGVLSALEAADLIVICPSNPWVSVDPILAVSGVRAVVERKPIVAVSPIIGGKTVKGPAAKMYRELGITPSAAAVARHYQGFLTAFVLDLTDNGLKDSVIATGVACLAAQTIMYTRADRRRLAEEILNWAKTGFPSQ
jgi:LPPG:FO 2-phospho-L-lactate transferase